MGRLLLLLLKRSSLILFLVMEFICAFLVVNNGQGQGKIYASTSAFFSGIFYNKSKAVRDYVNLNAVADSLASENALLRAKLASSRYINIPFQDTFLQVRVDSLGADSVLMKFVYTDAEVINNTVASAHNYFTLNKGSLNGIEKSMGVLSAHGIVGIVSSSSKHFTTVKSILNRDLKISGNVLVGGKPFFGSISWQTPNYRYMDMQDVPKYAKISKGDSIVTSGYSTIFPKGYMIGTVDSFYVPPGSPAFNIRVLLSEDMTSLQRVYVANNLLKEEQKTLEAQNE